MTKKSFQFFKAPITINQELHDLKTKPAIYWEERGEKMVRDLFKFVVKTVPAYRRFLKEYKIEPAEIKTPEDFKSLPLMTKDNYLRRYPYLELFSGQEFFSATTFSATSGSSGEPFYFPRNGEHDAEYEYIAELFLKDQFAIDKKKTLGVMGFAMGIWIGGIFTYKSFNRIAENGYDLTVIPTGVNKDQFLRAVKKFGHLYDQIILMGYPPFIKDALDAGPEYGIKWGDYDVKILLAAEGFSEKFREYLGRKAKLKNILTDTINMYGTVELGTMAHETSLANLIRHLAVKDKKLFQKLFPGATNVPTLAQYYPQIIYFEEVEGQVIASGYGSSIPLLRYRFADLGGVIPFKVMLEKLKEHGVNLPAELKRYNVSDRVLHLPFVYVYARSDLAVVFRGANIYPEEIRASLDSDELSDFITGKFTMIRKEDKSLNQILEINTELKRGVKDSEELIEEIKQKIIIDLCANNSEFNNEYKADPIQASPTIILWPYQHPEHFTPIGKQKWVKK